MKGPLYFRFLRSVHPPAVGPVGCDGAGPAVCRSVRPLFLPAVLALTVLFIVSGGCIYPDLKEFPEQERTLFLYNFSNSTFDSDTQVQLNRTLREEIHSKRDFVITDDPDQAVLGLYGEITLYRKEGRLYDNLRNPTRYELIVGARIRMRDRSSGRVLLSLEARIRPPSRFGVRSVCGILFARRHCGALQGCVGRLLRQGVQLRAHHVVLLCHSPKDRGTHRAARRRDDR